MDLDEGRETQFRRKADEIPQLTCLEESRYEKRCIRTEDPGLIDLIGIDDEVLSQQRQFDRLSDLRHVSGVALETSAFRQDGNGRCPVILIDTGDPDRSKSSRILPFDGELRLISAITVLSRSRIAPGNHAWAADRQASASVPRQPLLLPPHHFLPLVRLR